MSLWLERKTTLGAKLRTYLDSGWERRSAISMYLFLLTLGLDVSVSCGQDPAGIPGAKPTSVQQSIGRVFMESSDRDLLRGFNWAKEQALKYASRGDPVGEWYAATYPQRRAFCMRDVSHQSIGANVLGLASYTQNMLRKFAENISASRSWCSYWEITKDNAPASVDYADDSNFWYCLPANFDVLRCCYREFLWTGDKTYLDDPIFLNFYDRTVSEYVAHWDRDGDGIMESARENRFRGIPSYDENWRLGPRVGADLLAAQYAGYQAYAEIQALKSNRRVATEFKAKADRLKSIYNSDWWDEELGRHYDAMLQDRNFYSGYINTDHILPFWFDHIPEEGLKSELELDYILKKGAPHVELKSYLPAIFYEYGRNESAYAALIKLMDPGLPRRNYPEVSFCVIGDIAEGMMGIAPDASSRVVETLPRLTAQTEWVVLKNVPVFDNEISISHRGTRQTQFTNQKGGSLRWKASFAVHNDPWQPDASGKTKITVDSSAEYLDVDDVPVKAEKEFALNGQMKVFVVLTVGPGETHRVRMP